MEKKGNGMIDKGQVIVKTAGAPTAGVTSWLASYFGWMNPSLNDVVLCLTAIWLIVQIFTKLWDWSKARKEGGSC